jgi:cytidine deaminase
VTSSLSADALRVASKAYAPYSGFHVGAAVLTEAGNTYTGCNVENASSGLAICAERAAVAAAVTAEGPGMRLVSVAVANREGKPCSPCGACRQVLVEFGDPTVTFPGSEGEGQQIEARASELMPYGFTLD